MVPPIRTALWEETAWANHPLANKLHQYLAIELGFRDDPDPAKEALGLELLQEEDLIMRAMVWDDLEAQCYRYVRLKWPEGRRPEWGFSSQFLEALHTSALEELSKPGLTSKGKPARINHLAALRVIARIPQASAMEAYLAAIQTENPGSELYYLWANAIVDCVDPTAHQKFHHQLFPLFWDMIEKNYDDKLQSLLSQNLVTINTLGDSLYFRSLGVKGLFNLTIPKGIPHFERYLKDFPSLYSDHKFYLLWDQLLHDHNPEIQRHFIDFIPEFIQANKQECSDRDINKLQELHGFFHKTPMVTSILFEKEAEEDKYAKIVMIDDIFEMVKEFNFPQLYNLAIETFQHPNASERFKTRFFSKITSHAFPYLREVLHLYLKEKYAQQKEMAKSVTSVISKSSELEALESKINSLEYDLNKFEPTPETDFDEGLPII